MFFFFIVSENLLISSINSVEMRRNFGYIFLSFKISDLSLPTFAEWNSSIITDNSYVVFQSDLVNHMPILGVI